MNYLREITDKCKKQRRHLSSKYSEPPKEKPNHVGLNEGGLKEQMSRLTKESIGPFGRGKFREANMPEQEPAYVDSSRLAYLFEKLRQNLGGLHVGRWAERGNNDQILKGLEKNIRILDFFFFFPESIA